MPSSNAAAQSAAPLNHCSLVVFARSCGVFNPLTKVDVVHFLLRSTHSETFALPSRGAG